MQCFGGPKAFIGFMRKSCLYVSLACFLSYVSFKIGSGKKWFGYVPDRWGWRHTPVLCVVDCKFGNDTQANTHPGNLFISPNGLRSCPRGWFRCAESESLVPTLESFHPEDETYEIQISENMKYHLRSLYQFLRRAYQSTVAPLKRASGTLSNTREKSW